MAAKPKRKVVRPIKAAANRKAVTTKRRTPTSNAPRRDPHVSKIDAVIAALRTPTGASINDLMALTGWQMHSVRGVIAGTLKKKRGLRVISTKRDGERTYRIEGRA
ncbi:MAG: DUF3489 domain-containing protein [Hyphomonadaceae bacterium]|nr:DUF3489 domain-containing protein [Hyphomonadaceae bacterium]